MLNNTLLHCSKHAERGKENHVMKTSCEQSERVLLLTFHFKPGGKQAQETYLPQHST